MSASVVSGRMLVSISVAADPERNFAVPASLMADDESLTKAAPSMRQNTSVSSVSMRLHWGQRFILKPQRSDPSRPGPALSGFRSGRVLCRDQAPLIYDGTRSAVFTLYPAELRSGFY